MTVNKEMSVLIVDDYKTMLRVIRNLLAQVGFKNVDEATDGQKALDLMRHKEYGLIISDWNMEPMSGLDLLKTVRANDSDTVAQVPFIMITAENKMENVVAAKQAGVSNYIVKPFSAEILKSKMSSVLGEF
jgi:two-component system chemotaxis response regulator CheY